MNNKLCNTESINESYLKYSNEIYKLIEKDNKKLNLIIKYGHRSWKERLFSYPWKPWQDYIKKEKYYDIILIPYDNLINDNTYINNDGLITISDTYNLK